MPKLVTKEASLDASPVRTQGEGFSKQAITMVISNDIRTVVPQSKPVLSWSIARPAQLIGLAVALSIALLAAACSARPPLQSDDPQVQAAQQDCKDIPGPEHFVCIEQHAIATLNPEVCRLLGIAVDDACLQAVYEAANDPAICDRLYLPGVVPTCKAYYANPNRVPRLLTPTPIPDDARLGWLAYVLDGDIWIKYLLDGQPQRITDDGVNVSLVALRTLAGLLSQLFSQNHGGLHRWFDETWQRQGESYVLVDRQVEASPYNTLVEFFHALKTGGDTASWVASQQVLDSVQQMGLAKMEQLSAFCDTWEMPDCETMGPLYVFAAGDRRFFFDFLEQNGQFLIEGVLEDVRIGSPGGTP